MNTNSLSFRLFLSGVAWIIIILSLTAIALISICRSSIEESFDQRLNQYLEHLMGAAGANGTELRRPDNIGESLFSKALSGYYWQIRKAGKDGEVLYASESLVGEAFATPTDLGIQPDIRQNKIAPVPGPEDQLLRVVERQFRLSQGNEIYSLSVAIDTAELDNNIEYVTNRIIMALGLLGAGLLVTFFLLIQFTMRPLRDLRAKIASIRAGEESKLEGELPSEIVPLQQELNALIVANMNVVERARTHVGNLAHALKTPLSVIMNEADGQQDELSVKVREQAMLMRQQISHYLDRARIAAQVRSVSGVTDVSVELESLSGALRKIYQARCLDIALEAGPGLRFAGEKQDFDEMAGNLMDNACKWARGKVDIRVMLPSHAMSSREKAFTLIIDDDGPGLPEDFRNAAVKRGRRLDESVPGSGLGLSIVADLSHLYRGSLTLEQSPYGGLRARLTLPAA